MGTDSPQENKTIAENKSQPVEDKSTLKTLSMDECYVLLHEIDALVEEVNHLRGPNFASITKLLHSIEENKKLPQSSQVEPQLNEIITQLKDVRSYQQKLTEYGNHFEARWADVCARRSRADERTFEQHAAESVLLRTLSVELYQVTKLNVTVQSYITALEKHVPKSSELVNMPDGENPSHGQIMEEKDQIGKIHPRDKVMGVTDLIGKIHHFVPNSFLSMRLVQKLWKTSLLAYRNNNFQQFLTALESIHKNLMALSNIRVKLSNTDIVTRNYEPLVFYYCCLNSDYAEVVLHDPSRYGVTPLQTYLIRLCHDWLIENSIQELIRLRARHSDEFTAGYFIRELDIICHSPNNLMQNFIKPFTEEWIKHNKLNQNEWQWLNKDIQAKPVMSIPKAQLLQSITCFIVYRPDFFLRGFENYFKKATEKNSAWSQFYMAIFFITASIKNPESSIWSTDYGAAVNIEKYPLFTMGIIAAYSDKNKIAPIVFENIIMHLYKSNLQMVGHILDRYLRDIPTWIRSRTISGITDAEKRKRCQQLSDKYETVTTWLEKQNTWFIKPKPAAINDAIVKKIEQDPFAAAPIIFHKIAKNLTSQQLEYIAKLCVKGYPHIVSCIIEAHGKRLDAEAHVRVLELLPQEKRVGSIAYLQGIDRLNLTNKQIFGLLSIVADEKMMLVGNRREIKTSSMMSEMSHDSFATNKPASSSSSSVFSSHSSFYNSSASSSSSSLSSGSITLDKKRSQTASSPVSTSTPEKQEEDAIYINKKPVSVKQIEGIKKLGP